MTARRWRSLPLAAALVLAGTSCSSDDRTAAPEATRVAVRQQERGVTFTIVGRVTAVLDRHLFEVGTDAGRTVVLDPASVTVRMGRRVEVTGTLRSRPLADLEDEYGIRVGRRAEAAVGGRPVLVAASVAAV